MARKTKANIVIDYTDQINNIMDNFDFHKVHKVMETLDWKWAMLDPDLDTNERVRVPTEPELRKQARELLNDCVEHDCEMISTGGFKATKKVKNGEGFIELLFYVEDWTEDIIAE